MIKNNFDMQVLTGSLLCMCASGDLILPLLDNMQHLRG